MFENIPERLTQAVRDIPADQRALPLRYVIPAGLMIACYLRMNAEAMHADSFFNYKPNPDGSVSFHYTVRMLMVGETLFLMRSQPGFSEFCRRFAARDFRSTFFELFAARMFLRGGFELHARPEVGVKRNDFDFRAMRESDTINVEVTALTAATFSEKTVKNALNTKRKQIPDDAPAIIFCVYPESWFSVGPDAVRTGLTNAANRFFSSKRVNAIAFVGEQHWDAGAQGALFITHLPLANPGARLPISSPMDFFFNMSRESPRSIVERNNLANEAPSYQNSEFYQWVDMLLA